MTVKETIAKLVDANRILAHERVVDAFGHISVRHPDRPDRFLMSCSRSPELVTAADIMTFERDGSEVAPGRARPYSERFIHAAVYEKRPEVHSVVHNHSYAVLPFTTSKVKLRPMLHTAGRIGKVIPVWDIHTKFGNTNLLVTDLAKGRDLATRLAKNSVVLMRGHGCTVAGLSIEDAVLTSLYLQVNAQLQLAGMQLGPISFLKDGEIDIIAKGRTEMFGQDRAWEYLCARSRRG